MAGKHISLRHFPTLGCAALYRLFFYGLDWLYPPSCAGCGRSGWRWCPDCQQQLVLLPESICEVCGTPLTARSAKTCRACRTLPPPFHALRSWAAFEGSLRAAIHHLKYRRYFALGETLGTLLARFVSQFDWPVDAVIPVPLGPKRLAQRGYNQAACLALFVAVENAWHYLPQALIRWRETRSQVGLSLEERRANVQGAFLANPHQVEGRCILLVDDVATTGATLAACSQALREAGAHAVYAVTLARTLPGHDVSSDALPVCVDPMPDVSPANRPSCQNNLWRIP